MGGGIPPFPYVPSWQNRNDFAYTKIGIRLPTIYIYINTLYSLTVHVEFPTPNYFEN